MRQRKREARKKEKWIKVELMYALQLGSGDSALLEMVGDTVEHASGEAGAFRHELLCVFG